MTNQQRIIILGYSLFNAKGKPCIYEELTRIGFPSLGSIHLLPGADVREKINKWTRANWANEPQIMRTLLNIVMKSEPQKPQFLSVAGPLAKAAMYGVLDFAAAEEANILQLKSIFYPETSLGGTPVPKISKEFNNMSYMERQAILKQNLQRVVPVDQEDPVLEADNKVNTETEPTTPVLDLSASK